MLVTARFYFCLQLKYHESGREKMVNPRLGQWNMIDKVSDGYLCLLLLLVLHVISKFSAFYIVLIVVYLVF